MACTSAWLGPSYMGNFPSPQWDSSSSSPTGAFGGYAYSSEFYNTPVQLSAQQQQNSQFVVANARSASSPKQAASAKKKGAPARKLEDIIDCAPTEMSPLTKNPENCHSAVLHSYDMNTQQWSKKTSRVVLDMKKPINEGSCRYVYRMSDMENGTYVLKVSKDERDSRDSYFNEVAWLSMCAWYADKFTDTLRASLKKRSTTDSDSELSAIPANVRSMYVSAYVVEVPSLPGPHGYLIATAEPLLSGHFRKYTNNFGFVHPKAHSLPLAFSHFTYEASNKQILVCDIQGVRTDDTETYTDPQILSNTPNGIVYGKCDMGEKGIRAFFESHVCNELCGACGLPRRGKSGSASPNPTVASPRRSVGPSSPPAVVQQLSPPRTDIVVAAAPIEEKKLHHVQRTSQPDTEATRKERAASIAHAFQAKLEQALTALPTQPVVNDPFANIGELPTKRSKDKKHKREREKRDRKPSESPTVEVPSSPPVLEVKRSGLKEAFTAADLESKKETESKEALDRPSTHKHDIKQMLKGLQRPEQPNGAFLISSMFKSQDHAVVSMYPEPAKEVGRRSSTSEVPPTPQPSEPSTPPPAKSSLPGSPVQFVSSPSQLAKLSGTGAQPAGKPPLAPSVAMPATPSSVGSTPSVPTSPAPTGSSPPPSASNSTHNINGIIVNGGSNNSSTGTPTTTASVPTTISSSVASQQPVSPSGKQLDWVHLSAPYAADASRQLTSPTTRIPTSPQAETGSSVPNVGAEDDAEFQRKLQRKRTQRRAKDKAHREDREKQDQVVKREKKKERQERERSSQHQLQQPQQVQQQPSRSHSFISYVAQPLQSSQPLHRSASFGSQAYSSTPFDSSKFSPYGHMTMGGVPSSMYYPPSVGGYPHQWGNQHAVPNMGSMGNMNNMANMGNMGFRM